MPYVYRSMLTVDAKPVVGSEDNMLGVRTTGPRADVAVDEDGMVSPGRGLSVARNWRKLPPLLIPQRLRAESPAARGSNNMAVFQLEYTESTDGLIGEKLRVTLGKGNHGLIEPGTRMLIATFQESLAQTRDHWQFIAEEVK